MRLGIAFFALAAACCFAESVSSVLLVINENSPVSKSIGEYYIRRRGVPLRNVCRLRTAPNESITRDAYVREVEAPIKNCLAAGKLTESVLYIVTTLGVPLKIEGTGGPEGDQAAVDSELATLYASIKGARIPLNGGVPNPMFQKRDAAFGRPDIPIYMVTRLAGYGFEDVRKMIDRSMEAVNRGVVVLDLKSGSDETGNDWLRNAALKLPQNRVLLEESTAVVYGARQVIGYASWGSNDPHRVRRWLNFDWLPGAIATEYVSSDGRTFECPPENWIFGMWDPKNAARYFKGSPQSLTADLIHEGATGASGHVFEPYLTRAPRPDYLFPAYLSGRNLAQSYYVSIPLLSWMNIVVGDPLCSLSEGSPKR